MIKKVHNQSQLSRLVLNGYKSIAACDMELGRLNVLIGANGAGKSNFIGFFRLISKILDQQLQTAVGAEGGPDALLHFGRKKTERLHAELYFGNNGYRFDLVPTQDNRMMFAKEALWWNMKGDWNPRSGHFETYVETQAELGSIYEYVVPAMRSWRVHHFHDTSQSALVKQIHGINDNEYLREDGRNLAAFLYRLKQHHDTHYRRIVKSIQLVAPFFGDFHLRPTVANPEKIQLEWTEAGQDVPFNASALSDGTLRFIGLATMLLQPEEFMPASILIDEPELGLHPYAIVVLGGLINSVSQQHQIIISTQSVELVNEFEAEDLIAVEKDAGASAFKRLDIGALAAGHRGGVTGYGKVKWELRRLCRQDRTAIVSTMLDLYRLPTDFPGKGNPAYPTQGTGRQKAEFVEGRFGADINEPNFLPHVMVHEYETLLFVQPQCFAEWTEPDVVAALAAVAQKHPSPEDINEGQHTAPSKRILRAMPAFDKTFHGPLIASDIGLDAMRRTCPHFDERLGRLEQFSCSCT